MSIFRTTQGLEEEDLPNFGMFRRAILEASIPKRRFKRNDPLTEQFIELCRRDLPAENFDPRILLQTYKGRVHSKKVMRRYAMLAAARLPFDLLMQAARLAEAQAAQSV